MKKNARHILTESEQKQFLESGGVGCPCCNSSKPLEGQGVKMGEGQVTQVVECLDCELALEMCFTLTHINQRGLV